MAIITQDPIMEMMVTSGDDNTAQRRIRIFEEGDAPRSQTIVLTNHASIEYVYEQSLRIKRKAVGLTALEVMILALISKLDMERTEGL